MKRLLLILPILIAACAETEIQPLSQTSFQVITSTSDCTASEARKIANIAAAIEVIQRGGDRFRFVDTQSKTSFGGAYYNEYVGLQTYDTKEHSLIVQLLSPGDPGYHDSLSARDLLGPDWQSQVAKGVPQDCM